MFPWSAANWKVCMGGDNGDDVVAVRSPSRLEVCKHLILILLFLVRLSRLGTPDEIDVGWKVLYVVVK